MIHEYTYPRTAKLLHAGVALLGIAAFLTGESAEHGPASSGYTLHAYFGLAMATVLMLRIARGIGPGPLRFAGWSPFARKQWRLAMQDIRSLARLELPDRGMHEGFAGLMQAFGLMLFAWMGMTGTLLYFADVPDTDLVHWLEELHELGESLIPLYLLLHVGSVVVHSVAGRPVWQRMWKFRKGT